MTIFPKGRDTFSRPPVPRDRQIAHRCAPVLRVSRGDTILRAALEEFAVALLVPRLAPKELDRMEALLHRMEAAARRRAVREFNEADFQFHDAIFETCGHRTLHEVWKGMQRRIRAFLGSSNWVSGNLQAVTLRHRAILRALASRKLSSARRALRTHFVRLQEELNLLLARRSGGGNPEPPKPPPIHRKTLWGRSEPGR